MDDDSLRPSPFAGLPDHALFVQVQCHRDAGAFEIIYQRYAPLVGRLAARCLNHSDAQDIVQNVFIDLWEKTPPLKSNNAQGLLAQMTVNKAFSFLRKKTRCVLCDPVEFDSRPAHQSGRRPVPVPDDLWAGISKVLSQEEWRLLHLRLHEGWTFLELANNKHVTLGTVTGRYYAALDKLKKSEDFGKIVGF